MIKTSLIAISAATALSAALVLGATASFAGECPADKVVADGQGQKAGATAHKLKTDDVLAKIDLSKEKIAVDGHHLRLRRITVGPGGEVAWHSHAERPAIIYVVSGTITEYASTCTDPIVHKTGEVAKESTGLSHWWKNTSTEPVVLLSADIAADPKEKNM